MLLPPFCCEEIFQLFSCSPVCQEDLATHRMPPSMPHGRHADFDKRRRPAEKKFRDASVVFWWRSLNIRPKLAQTPGRVKKNLLGNWFPANPKNQAGTAGKNASEGRETQGKE